MWLCQWLHISKLHCAATGWVVIWCIETLQQSETDPAVYQMIWTVKSFIFVYLHYSSYWCTAYCCIVLYCCKLFKCHSTTKLKFSYLIRILPTYCSRQLYSSSQWARQTAGIKFQWERDFPCHADQPSDPPSLLYKLYQVFPGVKGSVCGADHPLLSGTKFANGL